MATTLLVVKNRAYSKLAAAITSGATSLTVTAGDGAKFPSTYPFHLTIEDEIVSCTNRSTDTLTIARAQQSTTAAAHANNKKIALNITAKSMTDLNTAVNTIEGYFTDGFTMPTDKRISFRDAGAYIKSSASGKLGIAATSSASDALVLASSGGIKVYATDTVEFDWDLQIGTNKKLYFRDTNTYIQSVNANTLRIEGATSLELMGTAILLQDVTTINTNKQLYFRNTNTYLRSWADGKIGITSLGAYADAIALSASAGGITMYGTVSIDSDVTIGTDKKIIFRDANQYIHSVAGNSLKIEGNTALYLTADVINLQDYIMVATDKRLQFRDAGAYIKSSASGKIGIAATSTASDAIILSSSGGIKCYGYLGLDITDVDGASEGQIWYDASENTIKVCTGSVDSVVLLTATQTLTNKTFGDTTTISMESETTATNALWISLKSSVTSGDLTGVRSRVYANADSNGANVRGGYFEAKMAAASKYAAMLEGALIHADYSAGSATISGDVRGLTVHISQGTGLNATNLYGILLNIQTRGNETIGTDDVGLMIRNEAVGGNGRTMDVAIKIAELNMGGGTAGFETGIDFSGATFATAEIDLDFGKIIFDQDGDSDIHCDTNDEIDFKIGGSNSVVLNSTSFRPATNNAVDLGTSAKKFKNVYVAGTLTVATIGAHSLSGNLSVAGYILDNVGTIQGRTGANYVTILSRRQNANQGVALYFQTYNASDAASNRITFTGGYDEATAACANLIWTGLKLGGALDGNAQTISDANVTVGTGRTLDVSAGTLTLANNQISGDKVEGGTIASITITSLTVGTLTGVLRGDSGAVSVDTDVTDLVSAASTTAAGKVELAIGSEVNTGTSTTLAVTPDALDDWTGSAQITTVGTLSSGNVTAQVTAATLTAAGKVELATAAEINTGDDTGRAVAPKYLSDSNYGKRVIYVKVLPNDVALTTGDGKAYITIPIELNGMNLVLAHAAVYTTASVALPAISLERSTDFGSGWNNMLSTGITIDIGEYSSYTATTAPVINGTYDDVSTGNWIRVNVDTAGTGTKGLDIILTFQLP